MMKRSRGVIVLALALAACDDGGGETDAGMLSCDPACDSATQMCQDGVCVAIACDPPCSATQTCEVSGGTATCVDIPPMCEPACVEPAYCVGTVCQTPLPRASHSTTIDLSFDNAFVAMANPDNDTVSVFNAADNSIIADHDVGDEPSSVVWHPNGTTLFVANQADHTVQRIDNANTASPTIGTAVEVGSEPTGIAISPNGTMLFVAEWGESRVSQLNADTLSPISTFTVRSPYAVAVTNNGDEVDTDERVIVTEFYGRINENGEIANDGRTGFVQIRPISALATEAGVELDPVSTGFAMSPTAFANQLFGLAISNDRLYVTSINAAPERPNNVTNTVFSVVYVIDISGATPTVLTANTVVLPQLVDENITPGDPLGGNHLADIVGLDFIGDVAYVVSRGGDAVQRLDFVSNPPGFGVDGVVEQIELNVVPAGETARCQMPTGIVTTTADTPAADRKAWVNCRVTRQLGQLALSTQTLAALTESATIADADVNLGMRFFFTARGRWARDSWSSCGSCHPGGLSDNITWRFGFGPRQTTSMDGTYSHPATGAQVQRALNWTANFDEIHDFERNTRGTSGGKGAVTIAGPDPGNVCGDIATEVQDPATPALPAPVGQPIRELATDADSCAPEDWDQVDAFVRTIRPPRGRVALDDAAIARGRDLFEAGCAHCHGGSGWTVSERFWTPSSANNAALAVNPADATSGIDALPSPFQALRTYERHIQIQPAMCGTDPCDAEANAADDPTLPAAPANPVIEGLAPPHIGCAIRNVQTFGIRNTSGGVDETLTAPLEQREGSVDLDGAGGPMSPVPLRALGGAGFNVPSLYGLQLGAPYLHHGQAETLEELLDPGGPWGAHVRATFLTPGYLEGDTDVADLVAFLLSIDATTPEVAVPAGHELCVP
jgi:DNA-binding beta-propeller fold protein YncE/cytochrome c peroxidase